MLHPKITSLSLLLIGSLILSPLAQAQSVLERYVAQGLEHNLALQSQTLSYEKSQHALREAKGLFFPQVSLVANYTLASGGRTLDFPIGDLLNPAYATLNQLTETQQFPTNIENVNEQLAPNNFQETKFRVIQPLFNSDILFNYRAKQSLVSLQESQKAAYRAELIKSIRSAYYDYLKTEQVLQIYAETESLIREILRVNQRLVEQDKATPDIVARAEHELSKWAQDQAHAIEQQQSARAYVNFLLNRALDTPLEVDSTLRPEIVLGDLDILSEQALAGRQELQQVRMAQAANAQVVQLNRFSALPKVNAVLDLGYQGFGYTFDQNQQYWLAQFSLQWDLFKGGQNRARHQQAQLEQQILQQRQRESEQQIQLQVRQAWYQVAAARQTLEASAAGVRSASQSFRLTRKQYLESQANLLELLDARTQFTQANLRQAIDTYELLKKQNELAWASGQ